MEDENVEEKERLELLAESVDKDKIVALIREELGIVAKDIKGYMTELLKKDETPEPYNEKFEF